MAGVMAEAARSCNYRPFASDCRENADAPLRREQGIG
jgi:hypothetical protein